MARYKLNHNYRSGHLQGDEGDEFEMDAEHAEMLERDSPGLLKSIGGVDAEGNALPDTNLSDLLSPAKAAELEHLRAQTPTIDIDPEDKALEVPGEGNKFTPSSGFPADPRVHGGRATLISKANRQKTAAKTRGDQTGKSDPARFDAAESADTSANARVTDLADGSDDKDGNKKADKK